MVTLRPRHTAPSVQVSRPVPKVRDIVEVLWEDRSQVFRGRLVKRLRVKGNVFLVSYDDGDQACHDLDEHYWRPAGDTDWVSPILSDNEASSRGAQRAESSQPERKRRRVSSDSPQKRVNRSVNAAPKRTLRNRNKPVRRPRPSKSAALHAKDRKSFKRRVTRSSVASQSETSTQLSSSKGSANEMADVAERETPIVEDAKLANMLNADQRALVKETNGNGNAITATTASSVDSNDKRVPPRKRKGYKRA